MSYHSCMIEIEICERTGDHRIDDRGKIKPKYHASVVGRIGYWGDGRTPNEAIGDLIDANPEAFGVSIIYRGKMSR